MPDTVGQNQRGGNAEELKHNRAVAYRNPSAGMFLRCKK